MSYDTIKDLTGTSLTQRSTLRVDGLRAADDATNAQTTLKPMDRVPRCTVRVATTSNIPGHTVYGTPSNPTPSAGYGYSGSLLYQAPLSIDGVTLAVHDRVFVKAQTNASENGIYQVEALDGAVCNLMKLATLDAVAASADGVLVYVRERTQAGYYLWTTAGVQSGKSGMGRDFMSFDIDDWYLPADGALAGTNYNNYVNAWKRSQDAAEDGGEITFYRQHTYGFDTTLEVTKTSLTWRGPNHGRQSVNGGRLYFKSALGGPGIRINNGAGQPFQPVYPGGYPTSSNSSWTRIEGLEIRYGGSNIETNDYHGIDVGHSAVIEDCCIYNWPGNAINMVATVQAGQSTVSVALVTTASFVGFAPGALKLQVAGTGTAAQPKVFFQNVAAIPAGAGGTGTHAFISSGLGGPFLAAAGTLTVLPAGTAGVTSVTNPAAAVPGSYRTNANLSSITRCRLLSAGKWGLYVDGSDVNAVLVTAVDATNCGARIGNGEVGLLGAKATCTATLVCDATHGPYTISAGTVTIRYPVGNLQFVNTNGGTLTTSGTLALNFQAVAVGAPYNGGVPTYLDPASSAFGPVYTSGVSVANGGSAPAGGVDMDGGGFFDSCFIENTYVQCHAAIVYGYAYKAEQGHSTFVGCYQESSAPAAVATPSIVCGGNIENGPGRGPLPGFTASTEPGVYTSGNLLIDNNDTQLQQVRIGRNGTQQIVSWKQSNSADPYGDSTDWGLQYFRRGASPTAIDGAWGFTRAFSPGAVPIAFTGPAHSRSHSVALFQQGAVISNVRFGGEAGTAAVDPPATSVATTGNPSRWSGIWNAGDFFIGTQLSGSSVLKETEPEFWRAVSNVSGNLTWRPSRDVRTLADRATLEGIAASRRMNGSLVHVREDNSLWQYSSSSTATDTTGILVRRPSDVLITDPGRWIRSATSIDLKLAIASSTVDGATLFTCPAGFRLRLISSFWEATTAFAGGASSSIGLSSSNAFLSAKGDVLGGAAGDVAAELATGAFGGTLGARMSSGRAVLKAEDTIRFDRIVSAFTSGSGFAHVVVQVV